MIRLIAPSLNFFCTLLALNYLPISIYTVIFQTNPFLISLAAYFFLSSQICRTELIAMVICFAAVLAICMDKSSDDVSDSTLSPQDSSAKLVGVLFSFLAALCFTFINITVSKLANIHWTVQIFQVSFCGLMIFAFHSLFQLMSFGKASVTQLELSQIAEMTLMGVSDMFYLISITFAF